MNRLAALVVVLALFAAPTAALADFHGPGDVESLAERKGSSDTKETAVEAEARQAQDPGDLFTRKEETIG